jgi:hypothetical protein
LNNEKGIQDDFIDLSIKPGKISIKPQKRHSLVEITSEAGSIFPEAEGPINRNGYILHIVLDSIMTCSWRLIAMNGFLGR